MISVRMVACGAKPCCGNVALSDIGHGMFGMCVKVFGGCLQETNLSAAECFDPVSSRWDIHCWGIYSTESWKCYAGLFPGHLKLVIVKLVGQTSSDAHSALQNNWW